MKEQLNDEEYQLRFTAPDVKVGTVIECEYTVHSDLFYMIHDWYAQCEIPVVYAKLYMDVPCYLIYHMEEQLGELAACHLSNTPVKIRPELMPSRRAEK